MSFLSQNCSQTTIDSRSKPEDYCNVLAGECVLLETAQQAIHFHFQSSGRRNTAKKKIIFHQQVEEDFKEEEKLIIDHEVLDCLHRRDQLIPDVSQSASAVRRHDAIKLARERQKSENILSFTT